MMMRPILATVMLAPVPLWTIQAAPPTYLSSEDENSPLVEQYIQRHKQYAVAEMERMGIPASIKLAQAIQESQYGQSLAAIEANNHFGIKCHKGWTGQTYSKSTGEYAADGTYGIEQNACFRRYATVEDSYRDHSEFLASRANYASLFQLPTTDYEAWAEGLRQAGYATDPEYGKRLIKLIRQYNLSQYDRAVNSVFLEPITVNTPSHVSGQGNTAATQQQLLQEVAQLRQRVEKLETVLVEAQKHLSYLNERQTMTQGQIESLRSVQVEIRDEMNDKAAALDQAIGQQYEMVANIQKNLDEVKAIQQSIIKADPLRPFFNEDGTPKTQLDIFEVKHLNDADVAYVNGCRMTMILEGETMTQVALKFGLNPDEVLKINDLKVELSEYPVNFYVFLDKKATTSIDQTEAHVVQAGETMYMIAQKHGIRLARLYQMNLMKEGEEPAIGEFIFVHKTADKKPKLQSEVAPGTVTNFDGGGAKNH